MTTTLTVRQHRALDRLANGDSEARVIGWVCHRNAFMPIVDAIGVTLVIDRRGAFKPPVPFWFTGYPLTSNMGLYFNEQRNTYFVDSNPLRREQHGA